MDGGVPWKNWNIIIDHVEGDERFQTDIEGLVRGAHPRSLHRGSPFTVSVRTTLLRSPPDDGVIFFLRI